MQHAQDQVARLGGFERDLHRLQVAHLADEHDVGIFAQRGPQGGLETLRVHADLALIDQAFLVVVHEFDRVLDRDHVVGPVVVDVIDHRRQRGGFAAAGWPGHEHKALAQETQFPDQPGRPSSRKLRSLAGIRRNTAATPSRSTKTLQRNRASPGIS